MSKIWNVAIYARVSTEKKEQQESIPAQVQSLKNWLKKKSMEDKDNIYNLIEVYEDLGFSGVNFERKSFIEMKKDIEDGKINMVITRDLSRFSRNYILAGYYLEDYFKVNGIRFVSVLDNVDTLDEFDDIVPFKNILNEMYVKDCSRKSRDGLKQRMLRGSSIASKPPYGYEFETVYDGNEKTIRLVPKDNEEAERVKQIYYLYINGWGFGRIANYLNSMGVSPPAARLSNFPISKMGGWSSNSIKSILINPKYAGMMMQGRWKKVSYKIKKVKAVPEDEWICGGEFQGIVSKELFIEVQKTIKSRAKALRYKGDKAHLFSGVLECAACGGGMCYRKRYEGYKCTNSQRGGGRCTAHSIKEDILKQVISSDLMRYSYEIKPEELMENFKKFIDSRDGDSKLEKIISEINRLDRQFEKLYLDRLQENINEKNYENILRNIQSKQDELEKTRVLLQEQQHENTGKSKMDKCKEILKRVTAFQDMDRSIINSLIDKIVIGEDEKTGEKTIDIFYKFSLESCIKPIK